MMTDTVMMTVMMVAEKIIYCEASLKIKGGCTSDPIGSTATELGTLCTLGAHTTVRGRTAYLPMDGGGN